VPIPRPSHPPRQTYDSSFRLSQSGSGSGEKDHTVPWGIAHAAYKRQKHNQSVTEITRIANRRHSLTIDSGWREVAQPALDFVKRFG
jgi:hypothetical protein